jgi:type VI secretion system protein ImpI
MSWAQRTPDPPPPEPEYSSIPTPRRQAEDSPGFDQARRRRAASPANPYEAPPASYDGDAFEEFIQALSRGARVEGNIFAHQPPAELGETLGAVVRLVVDNTRQLLEARQQAKRVARSTNQTVIQAQDNNPLKFAPTPEEALRVMFGPPTRGYLDARRALDQSFSDLKTHQIKTFSSMQHAVRLLVADLDPEAIERNNKKSFFGSLFRSRKARLWDTYVSQWRESTKRHRDGLVDAFMMHFSDCYDRDGNGLK